MTSCAHSQSPVWGAPGPGDQPHGQGDSRSDVHTHTQTLTPGRARSGRCARPRPAQVGPLRPALTDCAGDSRSTAGLRKTGAFVRGVSAGASGAPPQGCGPPRGGAELVRREEAACPPGPAPAPPSCADAPFTVARASRAVPATIFLISAARPIGRRTGERRNRKP